jgi:hypothetical protein
VSTAGKGRAVIKEIERLHQLGKNAKKLDVKELASRRSSDQAHPPSLYLITYLVSLAV